MSSARFAEAKKAYDQLEEIAQTLDRAWALAFRHPQSPEIRAVASSIQRRANQLEQAFKEKYQDLLDRGVFFPECSEAQ